MTIGIGLIGFGYWGPNLARNVAATDGLRLVAVADPDPAALARAGRSYPDVALFPAAADLIASPSVHAVLIASPVTRHAEQALAALAAGKHVLVEKPLALCDADATALIDEAERRGLVLMVDHTFIFNGAVKKISQLLADEQIGKLLYYDSVRINLGLFQSDVDVLWDLAVHDMSILDHLAGRPPVAVSCVSHTHFAGTPPNMAYLTLFFDDGLIAHTHVNWLSPVKLRRTLIGGDRRMIVYDDLEADEKIKIYDRGVSLDKDLRVNYRMGDLWVPTFDRTEALCKVAEHFRDCIAGGQVPITDGPAGRRVIRILEAAHSSAAQQGRQIDLAPCP